MRRWLFLVVCALHFVSGLARADEDRTAQAKEHFKRGTALYDTAHYLDAAKEYEAALERLDLPAFLFNIGQAYRLADETDQALAAYRGFVRRAPDAPQRAEAEEHIAQLEAKQRQELAAKQKAEEQARRQAAQSTPTPTHAAVEVVVTAPPPARKTPVYKKWWLWTLVGAGVAVVAIGVGVGVGQSKQRENSYGLVHF